MDPSIKFLIIAVIVICVILALIIFYIFFEALIAYISKTLNIPRPAFESTLNRPLIVYQNLLTSLKCNKILTVKDVLVWDSLDDIRARLEIEKFASNFCSL
jgi:hypothetical protein